MRIYDYHGGNMMRIIKATNVPVQVYPNKQMQGGNSSTKVTAGKGQ